MKPNFESDNRNPIDPNFLFNLEEEMDYPSDDDLSDYQYELLSSYIDGEANPEERRQVEEWLATDPQVKSCYQQLLQMSSHWRSLPVPAAAQLDPDQLAEAVFEKVNRRTYRQVAWGGTAIAALFLAAISGVAFGGFSRMPQFASRYDDRPEPLKIALNEPIVPMVSTDAVSITVNQPIIPLPDSAIANP